MSSNKRPRSKVNLYLDYLDTYVSIQRDPKLRKHMKDDPGYRWMKRITRLLVLLWCLLAAYYS